MGNSIDGVYIRNIFRGSEVKNTLFSTIIRKGILRKVIADWGEMIHGRDLEALESTCKCLTSEGAE